MKFDHIKSMALKPESEQWDEFHDEDIVNWKRIRLALEHENFLVNHRLSWLLSCQAFLFAAFAVIFQESTKTTVEESQRVLYTIVMAGLASTGMLVALYIQRPIRTAEIQHEKLVKWWEENVKDSSRHPDICGGPPSWRDKFLLQSRFPVLFIFAWIFFLLVIVGNIFIGIINIYSEQIKIVSIGFLILLGVFIAGIMLGRRQGDIKK